MILPRLLLLFVRLCREHAAAGITFSRAQIHLLESQMSISMSVSRDQGQGFGSKMGAQQMFGLGMHPALLLFDQPHEWWTFLHPSSFILQPLDAMTNVLTCGVPSSD